MSKPKSVRNKYNEKKPSFNFANEYVNMTEQKRVLMNVIARANITKIKTTDREGKERFLTLSELVKNSYREYIAKKGEKFDGNLYYELFKYLRDELGIPNPDYNTVISKIGDMGCVRIENVIQNGNGLYGLQFLDTLNNRTIVFRGTGYNNENEHNACIYNNINDVNRKNQRDAIDYFKKLRTYFPNGRVLLLGAYEGAEYVKSILQSYYNENTYGYVVNPILSDTEVDFSKLENRFRILLGNKSIFDIPDKYFEKYQKGISITFANEISLSDLSEFGLKFKFDKSGYVSRVEKLTIEKIDEIRKKASKILNKIKKRVKRYNKTYDSYVLFNEYNEDELGTNSSKVNEDVLRINSSNVNIACEKLFGIR